MSQIGPNIASSIVGGIAGQQRAGESRRAADSSSTQRGGFQEQLAEEINSDDLDTQVDSDAEGRGGGQGRTYSDANETIGEEHQPDSDDSGLDSLDLTA